MVVIKLQVILSLLLVYQEVRSNPDVPPDKLMESLKEPSGKINLEDIHIPDQDHHKFPTMPPQQNEDAQYAIKFTRGTTTIKAMPRTTPALVSLKYECDYGAYYCLKGHKTGHVCGRTLYNQYYDFENYCMLEYVNCMEGQEIWHITNMGGCLKVEAPKEYPHYDYNDDFFLDEYYTMYT